MHLIKKADNISQRRCVLHCVIAHLCRSFQSWRTFIPVCLFLFPPTLLFSPTTDGGKDVAGEMLNGNIEANGYHISSLHIIIWASLSCICTRACQTSFIKHKQSLLHLSLSRWLSHLLYAASPWSINRWTVEKLACSCSFSPMQESVIRKLLYRTLYLALLKCSCCFWSGTATSVPCISRVIVVNSCGINELIKQADIFIYMNTDKAAI